MTRNGWPGIRAALTPHVRWCRVNKELLNPRLRDNLIQLAMKVIHRFLCSFSFVVIAFSASLGVAADDAKGSGKLKLVESVSQEDLTGVVCVALDPDGRFVYASAWQPAKVIVFARDPKSGKLDHVQTLADRDTLAGATSLSISRDGRLAVAAAFQSKTVLLYSRDAKTGKLTQADLARDGEKGVSLGFPVEAAFSPDSRFVYILDDTGPADGARSPYFASAIQNLSMSQLMRVKTVVTQARGIAFHPNGKTIFVASNRAGAVTVAATETPRPEKPASCRSSKTKRARCTDSQAPWERLSALTDDSFMCLPAGSKVTMP